MSVFGKIFGFLKSAKSKVSDFFVLVLGKDAAKELGDAAVDALKSTLGVIVKDVVLAIDKETLTNAEKRAKAFDLIVSDAKKKGLDYSDSLVNLLIELVVQSIKQNIVPLSK